MIENFLLIGKNVLYHSGYYDEQKTESEKRHILLLQQSTIPKPPFKESPIGSKTICLDFDLSRNIFQFRLSDFDLEEHIRDEVMAFSLNAPKDKKKFLMTNNVKTFYSPVVKESLEYLDNKFDDNKIKSWFKNNISKEYYHFLQNILYQFYRETNEGIYILDPQKLIESQKILFEEIKKSLLEDENTKSKWDNFLNENFDQFKKKDIIKLNMDLWNKFINKYFYNKDSSSLENLPSIFLVTFDGFTILEYDQGKFRETYLNLCYYDLLGKYFVEKNKGEKLCYACANKRKVIDEIPLTMKFYGTTNNLYFENLSAKNAYKSFALCEECLFEILTGMRNIENYFGDKLFDMSVYIIPKGDTNHLVYKKIVKILSRSKGSYGNDIVEIKKLLNQSKKYSFEFDFLFYHAPQGSQEFNILKVISNIDAFVLIERLKKFDEISEEYKLNLIPSGNGDNSLTLNDLRFYLFPSFLTDEKLLKKKTEKDKTKVFRKDLLNFLESFLTTNRMNYYDLISRFVKIFKKRMHKDNLDKLSPFKILIAISLFKKMNMLKGGNMEKEKFVSEILNEDYKNFLDAHREVFGNDVHKQGLFLLGTVISKIIYAQKDKSSNFLKKLDFDGIPPRRIPALVNQVKEFTQIYKKDIYEDAGIWGNILDRLQGIENSHLRADEVVFYILTGISFADYLGIKKGYEKELNKGETNARNN